MKCLAAHYRKQLIMHQSSNNNNIPTSSFEQNPNMFSSTVFNQNIDPPVSLNLQNACNEIQHLKIPENKIFPNPMNYRNADTNLKVQTVSHFFILMYCV